MTRKPLRKEVQRINPDHRPMIPELRHPADPLDAAVRDVRRRYDELNPGAHMKWR